jgi:hypothetical protein
MGRKSGREDESPTDDTTFKVGYRKPPQHTRFKKGRSGNPRGRKKGRRNLRDVVLTALDERVWVREGDTRRKISKTEALVRTTVNRAIAGDQKAASLLMALMRVTNLTSEEPDGPSTAALSLEDELILADFLNRHEKKPVA